jgi:hypothetical protein
VFFYPSLLSHVLLSLPHRERREGWQNMGEKGGIAKHRI